VQGPRGIGTLFAFKEGGKVLLRAHLFLRFLQQDDASDLLYEPKMQTSKFQSQIIE